MSYQSEIAKHKRTITIAEAIGFSVVVLGTVLAFWSNTQTRLALLELNQHNIELDRSRIELKLDKINMKIDDVKDVISEIKINAQVKMAQLSK